MYRSICVSFNYCMNYDMDEMRYNDLDFTENTGAD